MVSCIPLRGEGGLMTYYELLIKTVGELMVGLLNYGHQAVLLSADTTQTLAKIVVLIKGKNVTVTYNPQRHYDGNPNGLSIYGLNESIWGGENMKDVIYTIDDVLSKTCPECSKMAELTDMGLCNKCSITWV